MPAIDVGNRLSNIAGSLDRSPQTLPVPLGGLVPAHRHTTALRRTLRRHRSAPLLALGLVAAAGGVWLSTPAGFQAGRDQAGVHVDDLTLSRVRQTVAGTEIFGGSATLVITTGAVVSRGGAVMSWNGVPATGRCVLVHAVSAETRETCDFTIGATRLTAVDRFDPVIRTWSRRYDDGDEITIALPAGASLIPIPFPLGR